MTSAGDRQTVLGLGGVFIRARDPEALTRWYADHLGVDVHDLGGSFGAIFPLGDGGSTYQVWSVFPAGTTRFGGPEQPVMLNFRVADLDAMLVQLRDAGVTVEEHVERSEYGAFGWCRDGEGNRVELWQPA